MLHGLDSWPFAPAAALAALERQPPAQQLELVAQAVQRGRLRFRWGGPTRMARRGEAKYRWLSLSRDSAPKVGPKGLAPVRL